MLDKLILIFAISIMPTFAVADQYEDITSAYFNVVKKLSEVRNKGEHCKFDATIPRILNLMEDAYTIDRSSTLSYLKNANWLSPGIRNTLSFKLVNEEFNIFKFKNIEKALANAKFYTIDGGKSEYFKMTYHFKSNNIVEAHYVDASATSIKHKIKVKKGKWKFKNQSSRFISKGLITVQLKGQAGINYVLTGNKDHRESDMEFVLVPENSSNPALSEFAPECI